MRGINRAKSLGYLIRRHYTLSEGQNKNQKCVFISHKKEDSASCEPIAKYLMDAGIDVYYDEHDKTISELVEEGNADKITEHLQEGIEKSTHMICVVTKKTVESYWVPFEVGYGFKHTDLGVLTLKNVSEEELPEYMKITRVIRGTRSLNEFIAELLNSSTRNLKTRGLIKEHHMTSHPLDQVLNWKL